MVVHSLTMPILAMHLTGNSICLRGAIKDHYGSVVLYLLLNLSKIFIFRHFEKIVKLAGFRFEFIHSAIIEVFFYFFPSSYHGTMET